MKHYVKAFTGPVPKLEDYLDQCALRGLEVVCVQYTRNDTWLVTMRGPL